MKKTRSPPGTNSASPVVRPTRASAASNSCGPFTSTKRVSTPMIRPAASYSFHTAAPATSALRKMAIWRDPGERLLEELQLLAADVRRQLGREPGDGAARSHQALHQLGPDRIGDVHHDDRHRRRGLARRLGGRATGGDDDVQRAARASSAARSGKRSSRPSAQRYSSVTVRPGIQPSWVRPATNASVMCLAAAGVVDIRIPTDGTLAGGWPSATVGSSARTQREGKRPHPERPAGGTSRRSIDLPRQRAISSRQAR